MEYQEIALGEIIYEVQRVYSGDSSAIELLLGQLAQRGKPNPSFDEVQLDIL